MIWFSIGSSGAVRSCRSDGCNSGVITCVVWLLTTAVISGYACVCMHRTAGNVWHSSICV